MLKPPTTKIVLVSIAKKYGKFPLKLRVTFNRVQKFYPCNCDLSNDEFNKIFLSKKLNKDEKKIKDKAIGMEAKALLVISSLRVFDFTTFEMKFYEQASGDGDVYDLFTRMHNQYMEFGQVGTAIMYNTVLNSLKSYSPKLTFEEITPEFLRKYESWMTTNFDPSVKVKSITTVGIYLRHLRAVYNKGISENLAAIESYPFKREKYIIPVGNNIKKALTLAEIARLFNYQTVGTGWECKAKDFWCFSYMCNGMNIMDIAKLKYKDIQNGEIHYERSKTMRTNRGKSSTLISIPILEEAQRIINKYGNKDLSDDNYIFSIIAKGMSPVQIKKNVQQFTKNMNDYTKKIAASLGIDKNVTTYVARHSFATILKRSGVTVEAISEKMGHTNVSTTKNYLDTFETESRLKHAQALVAFSESK